MKDLALVYMVAGISSRFGGKIKQFAEVGPDGEKLLEYSIKQAIPAGFSKIVLIVGEKTEKPMKEIFGNSYMGLPILYAKQEYNQSERDKPWGTADALCSAKNVIDCPFVVCNGDDLYGQTGFEALANHLRKNNDEATLGYRILEVLPEKGSINRGIFRTENNYVKEINEVIGIFKNDLSASGIKREDLCSMNIFALHANTIKTLDGIVKKFKEENKGNRKIECYLPVELSNLIKSGEISMRIYDSKEKWFGVTNPGDEEIVKKELIALKK
ncbi:MAG: sugar phosphate nucleotidyltransferase [Nanoarchaeota archaeon]|nr:sugar phosphate nucleotidyltransferase [Nanoarchaeota archaeon]